MSNESRRSDAFVLSPFQKFCLRWSVLFDTTSDRLSRTEMVLRTVQASTLMVSTVMTITSVLIADNKKALESFTYFVICVFSLAIIALAIRTKRFNRSMLLMIQSEFPRYDRRPMPDGIKYKLTAIRSSYANFNRNIILSYLALVVFEVPTTAMVPLTAAALTDARLGSQSTQMVASYFPFDTSKPGPFAFSFAVQFYIVLVVKFIITGIMCSFSFFVSHMIAELYVLAVHVKHTVAIVAHDPRGGSGADPQPNCSGPTTTDHQLNHLRDCARLHDRLCVYRDRMNESYGHIVLLELLFSTTYFCLSAFNMLFVGNPFTMVKGVLTLSNYLAEFFIFCMYGSMVEDAHVHLLRAAYGSAWYQQPVRYRRSLMMIMCRAQVPLRLHVGKVFVASLPLFLSVLKVSYSGFNALRAANE